MISIDFGGQTTAIATSLSTFNTQQTIISFTQIPSFVAFSKNEGILIGTEAMNQQSSNPENTFSGKRWREV